MVDFVSIYNNNGSFNDLFLPVLLVTGMMITVGEGVVLEAPSTGTGAAVPPQGETEVEGVVMIEGVKGITEMLDEVEAVNGITAAGMRGADTSRVKVVLICRLAKSFFFFRESLSITLGINKFKMDS